MTTREAARPLRRYMRARVRAASLAPTYTITRDVTSTVASARRTDRVRLLSLNKRGLAFALNRFLNSHPAPVGDRPHRELSTIS